MFGIGIILLVVGLVIRDDRVAKIGVVLIVIDVVLTLALVAHNH